MPNSFQITTTTNSIPLDKQRHGEAVFSVFNASGRATRGRARLTADNAAANAWLSLVGDVERDFAIAGSEQFTVHIAVPLDAPAANYTFHLDMIGVEHPDEDVSPGPTVTFQVPAPAVQKKPFPWWIVAVLAALVVIGGVAVVLLSRPKTVTMPGLVGLPVNDATTQLNQLGLVPQTQLQQSDAVTVNHIISTDPISGTIVKIGTTVTLTVASGRVTVQVPPVRGKSVNDAIAALNTAQLRFGSQSEGCGGFLRGVVPRGLVAGSVPGQGTMLPIGTSVALVVSNGLDCNAVPFPRTPPIVNPAVGPTPTPTP